MTNKGGFGATYGPSLNVFVVPSGTEVGDILLGNSRLSSQNHYGRFDIVWRDDELLQIKYEQALINNFTNFDYVNDIRDNERSIEVRLVPLEDEISIP